MTETTRAPLWGAATQHATAQRKPESKLSLNKPLFISPQPAGRKITAGFSWMQRIGRAASMDVWFPEIFRQELDKLIAEGKKPGPGDFPAQWAAVRQFELLQEAGNYKIYDMDASYLTRTLVDLARNMRAGGYRVTVATIGSYTEGHESDDLEILDKRLQDRIAKLTHMLYLEEQSEGINAALDKVLAEERWNYETALPHVGVTLGARDLFRPVRSVAEGEETLMVPADPHAITLQQAAGWVGDIGVTDADSGQVLKRVPQAPQPGEYRADQGIYRFNRAEAGRMMTIAYKFNPPEGSKAQKAAHKHKLVQHFFDILSLLPQKHIVHDTAVGLQLPESIAEQEWIYLAEGDMTLRAFNTMLSDVFAPFDKVQMASIDGRAQTTSEIKPTVQHMRGYGDRLTPEADSFHRSAARYVLQ